MAFLKVGGPPPNSKQRLYLLEIELPSGLQLVKIGKASGTSSKQRMMQICESIYDKFRVTPKIKIKRDREVPDDLVFKYESILHRFFKNCQYETNHKWSGCTEAFCIPLEDGVAAYEAVIEGNVPEHLYELPEPVVDELPF